MTSSMDLRMCFGSKIPYYIRLLSNTRFLPSHLFIRSDHPRSDHIDKQRRRSQQRNESPCRLLKRYLQCVTYQAFDT
ncbi:hypothetical protein FOYG_05612 [Fusarium oxysporum NRRL 32931]|uniref:Uncharacterized protein n=1 Tax=Fusarium oxysporum NRRL 32931 TaxID=660029 RepID=W9IX76_FUSOX|nr:hypothetical protein FOYG_05612 [Fusarium oxysporum NRRL 32931]